MASAEEAIEGALDIIAENISDNPEYRLSSYCIKKIPCWSKRICWWIFDIISNSWNISINTTWWAWGIKKNREDEVYRFHKKPRYWEVVIQQNISCCEIIYIRGGCEQFANSCSAISTLVVIVIIAAREK